jgi:hypothetical protein
VTDEVNRRSRTASKRTENAASQALRIEVTRVAAKDKQARREEARTQNRNFAVTVEQEGDTEEVRKLRGTYSSISESPSDFIQSCSLRSRLNGMKRDVKWTDLKPRRRR